MSFFETGDFLNFIAFPFLASLLGLVLGALVRKVWAGAIGGAVMMAFFQSVGAPIPFLLIWLVIYTALGLTGGMAGLSIRSQRWRSAILAGV